MTIKNKVKALALSVLITTSSVVAMDSNDPLKEQKQKFFSVASSVITEITKQRALTAKQTLILKTFQYGLNLQAESPGQSMNYQSLFSPEDLLNKDIGDIVKENFDEGMSILKSSMQKNEEMKNLSIDINSYTDSILNPILYEIKQIIENQNK